MISETIARRCGVIRPAAAELEHQVVVAGVHGADSSSMLQVQRPDVGGFRSAGVEQPRRPRERRRGLFALQRADVRRLRDRRQAGTRAEVPREQRRDLGQPLGVRWQDLLLRGSSLGPETRQPRRRLEERVPDARVVPVDEDRPAVLDAQVVAPHVEVERGGAVDPRSGGRRGQRGHVLLEPRGRADPCREERRRVVDHVGPAVEAELALLGGRERRGRRGPVELLQRREHRADRAAIPGRRPSRFGEVLDREQRRDPVVVPPEQPREERRSLQRVVRGAFVPNHSAT